MKPVFALDRNSPTCAGRLDGARTAGPVVSFFRAAKLHGVLVSMNALVRRNWSSLAKVAFSKSRHNTRPAPTMHAPHKPARFVINKKKSLEAVDCIAQSWPGVTQYFICKTFYFADKEHFLDWGRPISGDFYIAMPHGPVPSRIYELLKPASGEEDDWLEVFDTYLTTEQRGKLTHVYSKGICKGEHLSRTDVAMLHKWVEHFQSIEPSKRFAEVANLAHQEAAWINARELSGNAPEMDLAEWAKEIGLDEEDFRSNLEEGSRRASLQYTEMGDNKGVVS